MTRWVLAANHGPIAFFRTRYEALECATALSMFEVRVYAETLQVTVTA